jgi:hypothetical protein
MRDRFMLVILLGSLLNLNSLPGQTSTAINSGVMTTGSLRVGVSGGVN